VTDQESLRKKSLKVVVTFETNSDAMAMEGKAKEVGCPGRIIPLPSDIAAGCGLAWCADDNQRQAVLNALEVFSLAHEGVFEVELY